MSLRTTWWQLLKLHFSAPKMSDFIILNWAGRAADTNWTINWLWWHNHLKFSSITAILSFWRQMQITVISKLATHTCTVWLLLSWFILAIFHISSIRECRQKVFVTLSRFWLKGVGLSESVKKRKNCDGNLFLDNVEWNSKNLWKMISAKGLPTNKGPSTNNFRHA